MYQLYVLNKLVQILAIILILYDIKFCFDSDSNFIWKYFRACTNKYALNASYLKIQQTHTMVLSPGWAPPYLRLKNIIKTSQCRHKKSTLNILDSFCVKEVRTWLYTWYVYLITVDVPSFSALSHPDFVTSFCKAHEAEVKNRPYSCARRFRIY